MGYSVSTDVEADAYEHEGVNASCYAAIIKQFKLQPEIDRRVRKKDGQPFKPFSVCSLLCFIQKNDFGKKVRSFLPQPAQNGFAARSLNEDKLRIILTDFGLTDDQIEAELEYYRHVKM